MDTNLPSDQEQPAYGPDGRAVRRQGYGADERQMGSLTIEGVPGVGKTFRWPMDWRIWTEVRFPSARSNASRLAKMPEVAVGDPAHYERRQRCAPSTIDDVGTDAEAGVRGPGRNAESELGARGPRVVRDGSVFEPAEHSSPPRRGGERDQTGFADSWHGLVAIDARTCGVYFEFLPDWEGEHGRRVPEPCGRVSPRPDVLVRPRLADGSLNRRPRAAPVDAAARNDERASSPAAKRSIADPFIRELVTRPVAGDEHWRDGSRSSRHEAQAAIDGMPAADPPEARR